MANSLQILYKLQIFHLKVLLVLASSLEYPKQVSRKLSKCSLLVCVHTYTHTYAHIYNTHICHVWVCLLLKWIWVAWLDERPKTELPAIAAFDFCHQEKKQNSKKEKTNENNENVKGKPTLYSLILLKSRAEQKLEARDWRLELGERKVSETKVLAW